LLQSTVLDHTIVRSPDFARVRQHTDKRGAAGRERPTPGQFRHIAFPDSALKSAADWSNVAVMPESDQNAAHPITFSRRAVLKTLGTSVGAVAVWPYLSDEAAEAFARIQETRAAPAPAFLTPAHYATVERLTETIIPADEHSPGAREARVADYVDLLLAESDVETKRRWTAGMVALDDESRRRFQSPFSALAAMQAADLLGAISRNELAPVTPLEEFFVTTKEAAIRGYYTSEIGIHKELTYKGNKFLSEFVGCTHLEHGYTSEGREGQEGQYVARGFSPASTSAKR